MTSAAQMAIWSVVLLAMAGCFFGICIARLVWADDLRHTKELRKIWDRTETALRSTIKSPDEIIDILKRH